MSKTLFYYFDHKWAGVVFHRVIMNLKLWAPTLVMQLTTIVVTRNVSISVKTLHTLLKLNIICLQKNIANELVFIRDDPFEKNETINKKLKHCDRLLVIDYSVFVDEMSLIKLVEPFFKNQDILVLPCVTEGINWDLFKKKVLTHSQEPKSQMGLNFDTEVSKKLDTDLYSVIKTCPKVYSLDSKAVLRAFKETKKQAAAKIPVKTDEMFEKFIQRGLSICAYTNANVIVTYPHECLGNILETAGVTVN